jgi:DNA-binding transcriptional ArsR family regulator
MKRALQTEAALKAIAEPRRRELLTLLRDEGALSVGELADQVAVSQQAVSLHLKVLEEAGLVEARREGTRHIYAVRPEGFRPVQDFVAGFWSQQLSRLKQKVERK